MALGVHSLGETCGWAVAASTLKLRQREVQGELGHRLVQLQIPGPGWAEATLLGQEMTEAQGGMTCLRPPCEYGEKHVPLCCGSIRAALGGRWLLKGMQAGLEFLCFRNPGLCPYCSPGHTSDSKPGALAQSQPSRHPVCSLGPYLCEQRFLAAPGGWGPIWLSQGPEGQALGEAQQRAQVGLYLQW